ncbi:RNA polymerase sigma-70 factor (ECF subfamily) [Actinomadura pelletieri DSM 43383]|uniref:RNA polymerase sigma-70 factor (ECF subfamily) n=1 Tax=Actinomadura pelletieri DSM 43383 TaxID=1120940 RepID=A0A495QIB2_9ACTN|nr:RNA polymerase sigma-70 factor [Actinomadura pelletieri]RKS71869.1 RNA polymerase sigma-70 factor (ECF subfamily) [Actinomadura pelletieri DSM 43383]
MSDVKTEPFEEYRSLLFAVAYRMLGTAADAEDAVQDAWLRWSAADRSGVADPKAYLVRITTNVALDRLRSVRARRETYVGPWLPEPMLTSPDVAENAELSESVSMAMLVVLETLSPLERAVFVLKDVFGYPYAEIAAALDRSETSVRQLGTRARKHVEARRPRFEAGGTERRAATERFLDVVVGGDINRLMEVLAPDVTLWTDGGGKVRAARRVIEGVTKVARWLSMVVGQSYRGVEAADMRIRRVDLNGEPALIVDGPDEPLATITVEVDENERVRAVHLVANPDKLTSVAEGRTLSM